MRTAFQKDGTITAGNASSINDGGSALVVMSKEEADKRGLTPLATITDYAGAAQAPEWFTTAPAKSILNLLDKTGQGRDDVDLWEINEAFAVVSLANQDEIGDPRRPGQRARWRGLDRPPDRVPPAPAI